MNSSFYPILVVSKLVLFACFLGVQIILFSQHANWLSPKLWYLMVRSQTFWIPSDVLGLWPTQFYSLQYSLNDQIHRVSALKECRRQSKKTIDHYHVIQNHSSCHYLITWSNGLTLSLDYGAQFLTGITSCLQKDQLIGPSFDFAVLNPTSYHNVWLQQPSGRYFPHQNWEVTYSL